MDVHPPSRFVNLDALLRSHGVYWHTFDKASHVPDCYLQQPFSRRVSRPRKVRSHITIAGMSQRIICGWGLSAKDVQSGCGEFALVQGCGQRMLIHQAAAARVEQDRGRLHPGKPLSVDKVFRFGSQWTVQTQDIAFPEKCFGIDRGNF